MSVILTEDGKQILLEGGAGLLSGEIGAITTYFYVATTGDDANPGTEAQPLLTIEEAQTKVRAHIVANNLATDPVGVILRGGDWTRTSSFALTSLDSGVAGQPVVWKAYPGETVRILGGETLDSSWFSLVTSSHSEWARINTAARGNVYVCDLSANGITDYGTHLVRGFLDYEIGALELFSDESPMPLARWPNVDTYESILTAPTTTSFTIGAANETRMANWATAPEPRAHALFKYFWSDNHLAITAIDSVTQTITLEEVPRSGIGNLPKDTLYIYNLLEELTVAGEWYLERSTNLLYWWPNGTIGDLEIMVSMPEVPLMTVTSADYVQFTDISFGMGRTHLVTVTGGSNVTFNGCRFFGAGNDGLHLTGDDHSLLRSTVTDIGDKGVVIDGGTRSTITAGNCLVKNTDISKWGQWNWMSSPAVELNGVGHTASHNHLYDAPHTAILFKGNEHLIEYNEINNVCNQASDAGAIYAGKAWGWRGTEINYNYIHDIVSVFDGSGAHGVYLDDLMSGVKVFGNYFIDIGVLPPTSPSQAGRAIMTGGGRDCFFENNIMVRCFSFIRADSRGLDYITDPATAGRDYLDLLTRDGVNYQDATWTAAYPELAAIPNVQATIADSGLTWQYPEGCIFSRNLGWDNYLAATANDYGGTGTFNAFAEMIDNTDDADPLFVDEAGGDLRLQAGSPALAIPGFVDIPFADMGIEP